MPLYVLCFVKNLWNGFLLIKPQSCHCTKSLSHHNIHSRWIHSWEHFEPLRMSNKKTFPGVKHYPIITLLTNETDSNWFVIRIPSLVFWSEFVICLELKDFINKKKIAFALCWNKCQNREQQYCKTPASWRKKRICKAKAIIHWCFSSCTVNL